MRLATIGLTASAIACAVCAAPPGDTGPLARMASRIEREIVRAAPAANTPALHRAVAAIAAVPRDRFVPAAYRRYAYAPKLSLPIGHDQTISDPYVVALMTAQAEVRANANVLDVGTGSGYQAAVLAALGAKVTSIEIVPELAASAKTRLRDLGYDVDVRTGDGYDGARDRAPFDAIIVAAGADRVPPPLLKQLRVGGVLVIPIGSNWAVERLLVIRKLVTGEFSRCSLGFAMFVDLTGIGRRERNLPSMTDDIPSCYGVDLATPVFVNAPLEPIGRK